jgi:hypothetical protein
MVASTKPKSRLRNRNWKYANPNATSALAMVTPIAAANVTVVLLTSHRRIGASLQTVR